MEFQEYNKILHNHLAEHDTNLKTHSQTSKTKCSTQYLLVYGHAIYNKMEENDSRARDHDFHPTMYEFTQAPSSHYYQYYYYHHHYYFTLHYIISFCFRVIQTQICICIHTSAQLHHLMSRIQYSILYLHRRQSYQDINSTQVTDNGSDM